MSTAPSAACIAFIVESVELMRTADAATFSRASSAA
eukprot:CAMPEP_0198488488 /NCGR_PEP_ID=MMETSP1462-20131121/824_1 /TAXON_ID=1333877 /ORGANISM="Brandtodinium nutriculum, Strain RCC3387" /LENGTH=35 /DNA_ID= /DNA_START= /DNA_END= /DNA_ORIENTATION=